MLLNGIRWTTAAFVALLSSVTAQSMMIYQTRLTVPGSIDRGSLSCDDAQFCNLHPNASMYPVNGCFLSAWKGTAALLHVPNAYCPTGKILSNWSSFETSGHYDGNYGAQYTLGNCVMTTVCGL